jgi:hypothetical protein
VTLHHARYDEQSKKLHIERVSIKAKNVVKKLIFEVECKSLSHSIREQEIDNERLKKRVREIEDALSTKPLFAEPLAKMVPEEATEEIVGSRSKVTKATKSLVGIRRYIVENIDKRLGIMREAWEIIIDTSVIDGRIHAHSEYIQEDLQNDEHLYTLQECSKHICG